jgi:hypothetical protein
MCNTVNKKSIIYSSVNLKSNSILYNIKVQNKLFMYKCNRPDRRLAAMKMDT